MAAELGSFTVKENREVKNDKTITLSFVRFKRTGSKPGSPIVYLAGGPGGSGVDAAKGPRFELFMALREFGDVIAFEQRGTGLSNSLPPCDLAKPFPADKPGTFATVLAAIQQNQKACFDFWRAKDVDLNGYNILQNADDLEDLRKVLGVPRITLWGISFGTQLAFTFVNRHPQSVDKLIMAALEAPGDNIKYPHEVQDLLIQVSRQLQQNPETNKHYPDLLGLMKRVFDKLEAKPATVQLKNRDNSTKDVGISKFDVQLVASFLLLKNPVDLMKLPLLFKKMDDGDFVDMARLVDALKKVASSTTGMSITTDLMTGVDSERMKLVEKEAPNALLGRTTNFPFPDMAAGLNLPDIGSNARKLQRSTLPGLFFSATLDGRTFLESAAKIVAQYPNVQHVIIENAGHDMFEISPKVQDLIVRYMRGEKVEKRIVLDPVKFLLP